MPRRVDRVPPGRGRHEQRQGTKRRGKWRHEAEHPGQVPAVQADGAASPGARERDTPRERAKLRCRRC